MFPFGGPPIVMTPHGPMMVGGGGGGGGHVVMTPHGPMVIGSGGGGGHVVMTPHGPMVLGGGGFGGGGGPQLMRTPHGLVMVHGGDSREAERRKREEEAERERAAERRREEAERERAAERRREREAEEAAAAAAARARAETASRRARRSRLSTRSDRRYGTGVPEPLPLSKCQQLSDGLQRTQPIGDLRFQGLLTETPTGQALVLKAMFRPPGSSSHSVPAAVKLYLREDAGEFEDELRSFQAIGSHKNVMKLLKSYTAPRKCIVMELAEKGSLSDALTDGALPKVMVRQYAKGIADGLKHIHSKGLAHLDIKSENIMLTARNIPVLTDYGLAKQWTGSDTISYESGTYPFIAPEGLSGSTRPSNASKMDVYAFGCVLYEMLSGKIPFQDLYKDGSSDAGEKWHRAIKSAVLVGNRPEVDHRWDREVVELMRRCWEQDPTRRPTMDEVVSTLSSM